MTEIRGELISLHSPAQQPDGEVLDAEYVDDRPQYDACYTHPAATSPPGAVFQATAYEDGRWHVSGAHPAGFRHMLLAAVAGTAPEPIGTQDVPRHFNGPNEPYMDQTRTDNSGPATHSPRMPRVRRSHRHNLLANNFLTRKAASYALLAALTADGVFVGGHSVVKGVADLTGNVPVVGRLVPRDNGDPYVLNKNVAHDARLLIDGPLDVIKWNIHALGNVGN